jgi:hypothetical protein
MRAHRVAVLAPPKFLHEQVGVSLRPKPVRQFQNRCAYA